MLAQNFLSHKQLGITEPQQRALVKVLGMLERGELEHAHYIADHYWSQGNFSMNEWSCGSIKCIGGWAEHVGRVRFRSAGQFNEGLRQLFYPREIRTCTRWSDITVEQAATALRNYLTTGKADWASVVQ